MKAAEREFQAAVIDLAHYYCLLVLHIPKVQTTRGWRTVVSADGVGYPDLTIYGCRPIWRELKVPGGRRSAEQVAWGERLVRAGCDYAIWTPADLTSGRIKTELDELRRPRA